jgi:hypothetical protein
VIPPCRSHINKRARAVSSIRSALASSYGKLDAPALPTATTHISAHYQTTSQTSEVERAWGMGWAAVGSVGCLTPRALKEGTQLQSHRGGRLAWARRGLSTGAKAVTRSAAAKLRLLETLPQGPARSSHLAGGQPLRRF